MEWHSARGTGTMTWIKGGTVHNVGREAGGTTRATRQT